MQHPTTPTIPTAASPSRRRTRALWVIATVGFSVGVAYVGGNHFWYRERFRKAQDSERSRDYSAARAELGPCLSYWPSDPEVRLLAARVERRAALAEPFDSGWDRTARAHLRAAERTRPSSGPFDLEWELLAVLNGERRRVETHLQRLVGERNPETPLVLEALVRADLDEHRLSSAAERASQLIEQVPDHALGYFWRALASDLMYRNSDQMLDDYRRAAELEPVNFDFRLRLATRLVEWAKIDEARGEFKYLVSRQPDHPAVLLGLASCLRGAGDFAGARRPLERLLALDPGNVKALSEMGQVALSQNNLDEAERLLSRTLVLAPYDSRAQYAYGMCLQGLNRSREGKEHMDESDRIRKNWDAIRDLTRRAAQTPESASLRCSVGVLLLRNGDPEAGVHWLRSALALEPNNTEARKALAEHEASARKRAATPAGRSG